MPVRALEDVGLSAVSISLFLGITGLLASVPFLFIGTIGKIGWRHVLGALGIGSAFALYGIALTYTEIVRVVLLFYLAPAWSTIIECVFFRRRLSINSVLGLLFSFLGIVVIFRGELPIAGLGALGDWLALFAGLSWSVGSALMFSSQKISVPAMTTASFLGAIVIAGSAMMLGGGINAGDLVLLQNRWPMFLLAASLLGLFYLVPVSAITLWGATQIPPAMMSFLLTLEVIAAVASSALLLGERFGWIEIIGTTLIIAAALSEVVRVDKLKSV